MPNRICKNKRRLITGVMVCQSAGGARRLPLRDFGNRGISKCLLGYGMCDRSASPSNVIHREMSYPAFIKPSNYEASAALFRPSKEFNFLPRKPTVLA